MLVSSSRNAQQLPQDSGCHECRIWSFPLAPKSCPQLQPDPSRSRNSPARPAYKWPAVLSFSGLLKLSRITPDDAFRSGNEVCPLCEDNLKSWGNFRWPLVVSSELEERICSSPNESHSPYGKVGPQPLTNERGPKSCVMRGVVFLKPLFPSRFRPQLINPPAL